ncbi:MAG: PAS domain-containing protein [Anaerolineae bacterium]|nr:PAS domain-containing protein [Anaerolineae bacterium]
MPKSLRWRVATFYILLIVLVMGGLGIFLINYSKNSYLNNVHDNLSADAKMLAIQTAPALIEGDYEKIDALAAQYAENLYLRVTIIQTDGTVIAESNREVMGMENHLLRPEVQEALLGQEGYAVRTSASVGSEFIYLAQPIYDGEGRIIGIARVSVPTEAVNRYTNDVIKTIAAAFLIAALASALIAILLSNITTRKLSGLTQMVQKMTRGEMRELPPSSSGDEVGQLNRAFGTLMEQLNQQIDDLKTERARLSAVLINMTDAILIVDRDCIVQLINPAAQRIFGVKDANPVGKSLVEIIRNHQFVELWRKSLESGTQQVMTLEMPPDRLFIQGIASPLEMEEPKSILLVFQDLTRVRRLEIVRRDFVSNVSHELRTPLASMKAVTETLLEGALDDPPAAKQFLIRLENEIDNLTQLVQELLELSRIESGRVPVALKPISPAELVAKSAERMQLQAERAGIDLVIDVSPELPFVKADPSRMAQVLVNLIHNAIKFTNPGGTITIRSYLNSNMVIFVVEDTGVGIEPDNLDRIFERFYKTDPARSGGGTGLGLSIARHLVETHGGKVWAESTLGVGSKFFFSLPIAC